ncbi:MAG: TolC family protein [Bacteroidales bacterium]|nr:TolC family protein [Bacteroidales bacterium]MCB8999936.1 TolC family protein [Bacteroidales bacterium]MCB9012613.1 TolC family protein [Bacteroidales bacterium]
MKRIILFGLLTFISLLMYAQKHDLDYYLTKAKENSPLLQKNKNNDLLSRLDYKQIESILSRPEVNFEANVLFAPIISHDNNSKHFNWVTDNATSYSGFDLASTDGGQYQAYLSAKQPLFNKSRLMEYSHQSEVLAQKYSDESALGSHEIEQLITYQYILCLKAALQVKGGQEMTDEISSQLSLMKKLVEAAIYRQADLMLLQIEYQSFQAQYLAFLSDYRSSLYDLNMLCGINDSSLNDLQDLNLALQSESPAKSGFLVSYELDSLLLESEQNIFELKYKPQLYIFANAGLNAVYLPVVNRLGFSTGLGFSWNIFDGHQKELQREKTIINQKNLEFDKNYLANQAEVNKRKIREQIQSVDNRVTLLTRQLSQFMDLLDVYKAEFPQGNISVMDYTNLLKDFSVRKQEALLLKMEKELLINQYNYWNY